MKEYDKYRDSYLRYLGYTNEIGEAFRPLVPSTVVNASYGIATAYVFADVYDKASKEYTKDKNIKRTFTAAADVFLWQMFASVVIPGITINRITWLTAATLKQAKTPKNLVRFLPTAIGLCSIPLIIHPIDKLVDYCMDKTYRTWIKN